MTFILGAIISLLAGFLFAYTAGFGLGDWQYYLITLPGCAAIGTVIGMLAAKLDS
jgi:hypothetical protein